ncbi:hypothetical protein [Desulfovibrio sp. 86]|uniref:hypothetical protein n=1 Tax=Desulfovibrio sp. 86 TaxID=2666132 RepID=UPI0015D106E0|nr:hypothetical protein [Desulfovibrio sp. 86]
MSVDSTLKILSEEIRQLEAQAALVHVIRSTAKNGTRLTEFGQELVRICLKHQISQAQIAKILDISPPAVHQYAAK